MFSTFAFIESVFQSTLSVRRATWRAPLYDRGLSISIHALRKESDGKRLHADADNAISIHALRKESDPRSAVRLEPPIYFNPRSP